MSRDITQVNSIIKTFNVTINSKKVKKKICERVKNTITFIFKKKCVLGLVLFLEEDHYVAEDFLHLLALMQKRANELCTKCNILSLGTYLKTFNYYTYANVNKVKWSYIIKNAIQIDFLLK